MRSDITFSQLEKEYHFDAQPIECESTLAQWYQSVRDKKVNDLSVEDLCISCRQALYPDYIIPVAIAQLEREPLAGEQYDGELIVALKSIPVTFWERNDAIATQLAKLLRSLHEEIDPDLRDDINHLLGKTKGSG